MYKKRLSLKLGNLFLKRGGYCRFKSRMYRTPLSDTSVLVEIAPALQLEDEILGVM